MTLRAGEILEEKYRIVRPIGEGGMGAVFLGENIRVKKMVAIKVLHANAGGVSDAIQRFEREAQAAGQIGSDHIVEVYDLGTTQTGDRFMVMEYLEGDSLRQRVHRGQPVDASVIIPILLQLLDGLAAAHAAGIVHRDLKPDNVFILREKAGRKDFVKILDFGISKFMHIGTDGAVTRTGVVMGSPNYMSPEQVKSSTEVDGRSDLYTVGVILFEAATGHVPFKANTFAELLFKIVYEPLPDPRSLNPSIDEAFCEIIVKACACDRAKRYQTAAEFRAALVEYAESRDRRSTLRQAFKVEPVPAASPSSTSVAAPARAALASLVPTGSSAIEDEASDSARTLAIELPPGPPAFGANASSKGDVSAIELSGAYVLLDETSVSGERSVPDFGSLPDIPAASNGSTIAMSPAPQPNVGGPVALATAPFPQAASAPPGFVLPPSPETVASGNGTGGRFSSTLQPSVQSPIGFERPRSRWVVPLIAAGMVTIASATAAALLYLKAPAPVPDPPSTQPASRAIDETIAPPPKTSAPPTAAPTEPAGPSTPPLFLSAVPTSPPLDASAKPGASVHAPVAGTSPPVRPQGTGKPGKPGSDVLGY